MKYSVTDSTFKVYLLIEEVKGRPMPVPMYKNFKENEVFVCVDTTSESFLPINSEIFRKVKNKTEESIKNEPYLETLEIFTVKEAQEKYKERLVLEWAEFKRWDYNTYSNLVKRSLIALPDGSTRTDYLTLRVEKIKKLLVDWSLQNDGVKIEIKRKGDELTKDSLERVLSVSPPILTQIMTLADLVLEFSQEEQDFFTKDTQPTLPVKQAE
ncbi:MAG: hypothetical protein WC942_08825 [Clostridia bacterium]|jgi:hypothetical protein